MGTQKNKEIVALLSLQEQTEKKEEPTVAVVTEKQLDNAIQTRRPPKIYDLEIQADGSAKVSTDISPQDMKYLLEFAFVQLMAYGFTVNSLAGFFPTPEEQEKRQQEQFLLQIDPEQLTKQ